MGNAEGMIQENNKILKEYSLLWVGFFAGIVCGLVLWVDIYNLSAWKILTNSIWALFDVVLMYRWASTTNTLFDKKNSMPLLLAIIVGIVGIVGMWDLISTRIITWIIIWYLIFKIWRRSLWMTMPEDGCIKYLISGTWLRHIFGSQTGTLQIVAIGYCVFIGFFIPILWLVLPSDLLGLTEPEPSLPDGDTFLGCFVGWILVIFQYISIQYLFNSAVRVCKEPPENLPCCKLFDVIISCVLLM